MLRVSTAAERWLARQGYGREDLDDVARGEDPDDAQTLGGRAFRFPARCASCDGYNLHAGVGVGGEDREALERLCRYVGRPPLAKLRLEEGAGDTVVLRLRRPWSDGTTALQFTKAELTEKLWALVPPPHANTAIRTSPTRSRTGAAR